MRLCSKCQQPNHNSATCGKPKKENKTKGNRRCGKCGQANHNSRTCQTDLSQIPEGHRLRLEQKQATRIPDKEGSEPHKGLWIVSKSRKKIAGKIVQVKKDGTIMWEDSFGTYVDSTPESFERSDYIYCELEPKMLTWARPY